MFKGFSPKTITFLQGLNLNNNKSWFLEHEEEYRSCLLEPMRDLVSDLAETMLDIDSEFETSPAQNKTLSRIYRDTRFSRDKSMFRSRMWFTFKRPGPNWQNEPGYFFQVAHDHFCYGMGLYMASRETMERFRAGLAEKPNEFREAIAFLADAPHLTLEGDQYKRVLNPSIPADLQTWYQRKSFYLFYTSSVDDRLFSGDLACYLANEFTQMAPLYKWIWKNKTRKGP